MVSRQPEPFRTEPSAGPTPPAPTAGQLPKKHAAYIWSPFNMALPQSSFLTAHGDSRYTPLPQTRKPPSAGIGSAHHTGPPELVARGRSSGCRPVRRGFLTSNMGPPKWLVVGGHKSPNDVRVPSQNSSPPGKYMGDMCRVLLSCCHWKLNPEVPLLTDMTLGISLPPMP